MNFLISNKDLSGAFPYLPEKTTFTNYNYRSSNADMLDRTQSGIKDSFTIRPKGVYDTYPQPYETGSCVSPKERTQIGFDIHKNDNIFSDIPPLNPSIPSNMYPLTWGLPPNTTSSIPQDLVVLPPPYGEGSVVLRDWIIRNMDVDELKMKTE
jgi:hypothetical protein